MQSTMGCFMTIFSFSSRSTSESLNKILSMDFNIVHAGHFHSFDKDRAKVIVRVHGWQEKHALPYFLKRTGQIPSKSKEENIILQGNIEFTLFNGKFLIHCKFCIRLT